MPARSRTKGQSAIVVACVLLVFGCGNPSGVPDSAQIADCGANRG